MNLLITDKHKEILFQSSLNQYKNISRLKLYFGHSIYQMNIDDGVVTEAKYNIERIENAKNKAITRKVHIYHSPGYIYVSALNLTNAHKKFDRILLIVDRIVKSMPKEDVNSTPTFPLKGEDISDAVNSEVTENNSNIP